MTKSNLIFELTQDIYAVGGEFSNLTDQFLSMEVDKPTYDKQTYILACKTHFLQEVVNVVRSQGYKFMRHEKEIDLLDCLADEISSCMNLKGIESLTEQDMLPISLLTKKYNDIVNIDDISEEFNV